jgi:hypothetical protein
VVGRCSAGDEHLGEQVGVRVRRCGCPDVGSLQPAVDGAPGSA